VETPLGSVETDHRDVETHLGGVKTHPGVMEINLEVKKRLILKAWRLIPE
jgi:hypothetical protein